jgi:anthranilate phosphoribosyltransferase
MSAALTLVSEACAQGVLPEDKALDDAFAVLMDGAAEESAIIAFLRATQSHMIDPRLIAAGARALRARMMTVEAPHGAIDVCGTGGDGAHSLNISTAVAFVTAGAGIVTAKHGNRAMSSKTGAADVLEALGVRLSGDTRIVETALAQARVAFLFAQNHHPAMRHVAPARRAIGERTIFNLLGPLCNPAGVKRQLVGVFAPHFAAPMASALQTLGALSASVVHGCGGLDELSAEGENLLVAVTSSGAVVTGSVTARDLGLPATRNDALKGGDASYNAARLKSLLQNPTTEPDYANVVLLNAAYALVVANAAPNPHEALALAKDSLMDGRALRALEALVDIMRRAP